LIKQVPYNNYNQPTGAYSGYGNTNYYNNQNMGYNTQQQNYGQGNGQNYGNGSQQNNNNEDDLFF
jgi:hypothetical protein